MQTFYARHSETLQWFAVNYVGEGTFASTPHAFSEEPVAMPVIGFEATHTHYKGHPYRRYGIATVKGEAGVFVFYGDFEGNFWLRPKVMFEDHLEDGRRRFTPIDAAAEYASNAITRRGA